MICQSVFDPDSGELLGTVQVAERLEGEDLAAFVRMIRAARQAYRLTPDERRAELERLQHGCRDRIRERNERLLGGR